MSGRWRRCRLPGRLSWGARLRMARPAADTVTWELNPAITRPDPTSERRSLRSRVTLTYAPEDTQLLGLLGHNSPVDARFTCEVSPDRHGNWGYSGSYRIRQPAEPAGCAGTLNSKGNTAFWALRPTRGGGGRVRRRHHPYSSAVARLFALDPKR